MVRTSNIVPFGRAAFVSGDFSGLIATGVKLQRRYAWRQRRQIEVATLNLMLHYVFKPARPGQQMLGQIQQFDELPIDDRKPPIAGHQNDALADIVQRQAQPL